MFTPLHMLPDRHFDKVQDYSDRWRTSEGENIHNKIMVLLEAGGGEHFLECPYERGELSILEDSRDLKGIDIFGFEKEFPLADNFKGIDFSFSNIYNSTFKRATFLSPVFHFVKFYNVEFIDCTFLFANFFGSTFEKTKFVKCDFIEHNYFKNSQFSEFDLQGCFFPNSLFIDCKFDERTVISELRDTPVTPTGSSLKLDKKDLAEIYKGIKDGYREGNVTGEAISYFVKERQSVTRYNTPSYPKKASFYFLEFVTGYGVRPLRVLFTMLAVFVAFLIVFTISLGSGQYEKALWLSSGAFFTFGAATDLLLNSCPWMKVLYVAESFSGVSLMAILVTVLANRWFSDK